MRQPVGEPDDAVALSADGRRGCREAFLAVQDKPFDVGGQLDERETDAGLRRAQGYVGPFSGAGYTGSASVPLMVIAGMQR